MWIASNCLQEKVLIINIDELYALRLLTNSLKNILLAMIIINTEILLSNCAKHVITIIYKN